MRRTNGKKHCRLCGTTQTVTRHHLIPQREATRIGDGRVGFDAIDVRHPRNVVPLCRRHHDAVERGVLVSTLRDALRTSEVMHIERVAGRDWLDANYPTREDLT